MTYSEKLKSPKWQKKRLEILNRDEFTCKLCGDSETQLHVHHLEYEYDKHPADISSEKLITYCEHCHELVETIKSYSTDFLVFKVLKLRHYRSVFHINKSTGIITISSFGVTENGEIEFMLHITPEFINKAEFILKEFESLNEKGYGLSIQ